FVGLKVNLWTLTGWQVPLLVIGIAVFGKTIGCYVGSRLGGMKHWESLAVGFGMNARGAMGLIVALLGLSLGLLTPEMFSIIVLMAIVTSFLAPVLLRAVIPKLTLSQDEERRLADDEAERLIPAGPLRVLVPTAGGGNALGAFALAAPLVKATNGSVTALFVAAREEPTMTRLLRRLMGNPSLAGKGLETHLAQVGERLGDQKKLLTVKRVRSTSPADAVIEEQERDYDLLMIGAAPRHLVGRSMIVDVLGRTKLPSVIVRATEAGLPKSFAHLMVPVDGSVFSREAAEFALAYAQAADAQVTLLHVVDETWVAGSLLIPDRREAHSVDDSEAARIEAQIREDF